MTAPTFASGAGILILGDFGAPWWVFGVLLLWPATLGLPSTLAVILLASLWGHVSWAAGLPWFLTACLALAWSQLPPATVAALLEQENLIERDYQLKRALGFPEEVFTRGGALLGM